MKRLLLSVAGALALLSGALGLRATTTDGAPMALPTAPQGGIEARANVNATALGGPQTPAMVIGNQDLSNAERVPLMPQRTPAKYGQYSSVTELAGNWVQSYDPVVTGGIHSGGEISVTAVGTDSIAITDFWAHVNPNIVVKAKVDLAANRFYIPSQYIFPHSQYGPLSLCAMQPDGKPDRNVSLQGYINEDGSLTVTSPWGIYCDEGPNKDRWLAVCQNLVMERANGTMSYTYAGTGGNVTETYNVRIEQPSENLVIVKNFFNAGYPLEIVLTAGRQGIIYNQQVMQNVVESSVLNWKTMGNTDFQDGKLKSASYNFITPAAAAGDNRHIRWTNWTLLSEKYYYADIKTGELTSSFDITYPKPVTGDFEGDGTETNPYKIKTLDDLIRLSDQVNSSTEYNGGAPGAEVARVFLGKYFRVENDIDMKDYRFTPIGADGRHLFAGILDGNGKTVSNLNVNAIRSGYAALIGNADTLSVIKNLTMADANVRSEDILAASLVACSYGVVENCNAYNCTVTNEGLAAGGIGGRVNTMRNCTAINTKIYAMGGFGGGIAAEIDKEITGCKATQMYLEGNSKSEGSPMGGIVANMLFSKASDCYFQGTIDTRKYLQAMAVGGIAGLAASASIDRCYAVVDLSSYNSNSTVGGIAGALYGSLTNSYSIGNVYGYSSKMVGGLVGRVRPSASGQSVIKNCYTATTVTCDVYLYEPDKGMRETLGLIDNGSNPTIENVYFDKQITNFNSTRGPLTTAQLTSAQGPTGFDASVWVLQEGYYPRLQGINTGTAADLSASALVFDGTSSRRKIQFDTPFHAIGATRLQVLFNGKPGTKGHFCTIENNNMLKIGTQAGTDTLYFVNGKMSYTMEVQIAPACWEGLGTEESPFLIQSKTDLILLSRMTTLNEQYYPATYFKQTADIDMEYDSGFLGICGDQVGNYHKFLGTYDGGGHTIHRIRTRGIGWTLRPENSSNGLGKVDYDTSVSYQGFIGCLGESGVVKNLTMAADCDFESFAQLGGIVCYNYGTVENCRNYAKVTTASNHCGGITGQSIKGSVVRNCFNAGEVICGYENAGGICSSSAGIVENCINVGNVRAIVISDFQKNPQVAGGIVAKAVGCKLINVVNFGTVEAEKGEAGGIAGSMGVYTAPFTNSIENGLNFGTVTSPNRASTGAIIAAGTTQGISSGPFKGVYYDRQIVPAGAAANNVHGDMPGLETAVFLNAQANAEQFASFDKEVWDFTPGMYPVLKSVKDIPEVAAARAIILNIPTELTVRNLTRPATLSAPQSTTWSLANATQFKIENNQLVPPTEAIVATYDTLMATNPVWSRAYVVSRMPLCPLAGQGTRSNPYLITSENDWVELADWINVSGNTLEGKYLKLTTSLNFTERTFIPLAGDGVTAFNGDLDGNGKTVGGLTISTASTYGGVIGTVGSLGNVHNLTIDANITSAFTQTGGFCGRNYGTIEDCVFQGSVTSTKTDVAGFAAKAFTGARFINCVNKANVKGAANNVAGFAATTEGGVTFEKCTNKGKIESSAKSNYMGGIVAIALPSQFIECVNEGTFGIPEYTSTQYVGGIVGQANGNATTTPNRYVLHGCVNRADIKAKAFTGGIVGTTASNGLYVVFDISGCTNEGNIISASATAVSSAPSAGIITFYTPGTVIADCVNTGTIQNTKSTYTAGIAGTAKGNPTEALPVLIKGCVNKGEIKANGNQGAGIVCQSAAYLTVDSCANHGTVRGTWGLGGIMASVATGPAYITNCYNTGNISGTHYRIGGIYGYGTGNPTYVENCWNSGSVSTTSTKQGTLTTQSAPSGFAIGGIAGYGASKFTGCYNVGSVRGASRVGGMVGQPYASRTTITNCYSAGKVSAITVDAEGNRVEDSDTCGMIVGVNINVPGSWNENNTVTDTWYVTDNDSKANLNGVGTPTTIAELAAMNLTGWINGDEYTYPIRPTMEDDAARVYAARVVLKGNDAGTGIITGSFHVGCPSGAIWSNSIPSNLNYEGTKMWWNYDAYVGSFSVTVTCGEWTRSELLTADKPAGTDALSIDLGQPVSEEYYTTTGLRVPRPENRDGQIYIVVRRYSDGTVRTSRICN